MDGVRRISLPASGPRPLLRLLAGRSLMVARAVGIRKTDTALVGFLGALAPAACSHLGTSAIIISRAKFRTVAIVRVRDTLLDVVVLTTLPLLAANRG